MDKDPTSIDQEALAASMDAEVELLELLPELFQDLEDLGARADDVLELLSYAQLKPGARMLDLGCGKGAALIAAAKAFGVSGLGVDAMADFVEHAKRRTDAHRLSAKLVFKTGDVCDVVEEERGYDVVMMLALGSVFGDLSETVAKLRKCVRPGGFIVIDDAFLNDEDEDEVDEELRAELLTHEESVEALTTFGDDLVAEMHPENEEYREWCREMTKKIVSRAERLAEQLPERRGLLLEFAQRQKEETQLMLGPITGATWLLRRSED